MMVAQHALCLRNELVKFADETFEDKPHSSTLECFNATEGYTTSQERTGLALAP